MILDQYHFILGPRELSTSGLETPAVCANGCNGMPYVSYVTSKINISESESFDIKWSMTYAYVGPVLTRKYWEWLGEA